jgi:hypothetical protein
MLFAILEFTDFGIILLIVALFSGGAAASVYLRPADRNRLERVEHKLDLILTHLGLDYTPPPKAQWQELAADPSRKISAIKALPMATNALPSERRWRSCRSRLDRLLGKGSTGVKTDVVNVVRCVRSVPAQR